MLILFKYKHVLKFSVTNINFRIQFIQIIQFLKENGFFKFCIVSKKCKNFIINLIFTKKHFFNNSIQINNLLFI